MARTTGAPRVSVVIPTYNHRDLVLATLDSVFAQTFRDLEVIVVNDGSPDDTAALLRPLVDAGRIRYVEQPNRGQGAARNRGIGLARGEYVALLDDDDLWPPDKLAWQVEALDADPDVVLVYGLHDKLYPDGRLVAQPPSAHPSGEAYGALLRGYCLISPGQALVRASALQRVGGFDPGLWGVDDWDLYLRLARVGAFRFGDRVALHYRMHERNASHDAVRHVRSAWRVARKHVGWNPFRKVAMLRGARSYYVPNLLRSFEEALDARRYGRAAEAYLHAALLEPGLLLRLRPRRVASALTRMLGGSSRRRPAG